MKTLLLVRHAQAVPLEARIQDIDRPLTSHGVQQAAKVGHALFQAGMPIDRMLVSGAVRTQATATILRQALQNQVKVCQVLDAFYLASEALIWAVVTRLDDAENSLMIVGHNPGLEALGRRFVPTLTQLPTAGVVEVLFNCASWRDVGESTLVTARVL